MVIWNKKKIIERIKELPKIFDNCMLAGAQANRIALCPMILTYGGFTTLFLNNIKELVTAGLPLMLLPIIAFFPLTIGAFDFFNGYYLLKIKKFKGISNTKKWSIYWLRIKGIFGLFLFFLMDWSIYWGVDVFDLIFF